VRTQRIVRISAAATAAVFMFSLSWSLPDPGSVATAYAQENGNGADAKKRKKRAATLVGVDEVRIVPMAQTLPLVGRLVALRAGTVAARIDAPVAEMAVDIGDRVKKGQLLAKLADQRFALDRDQKLAELNAAKAAVETAKARIALAEQELKRYADLRNSSAFPKARYEDKLVDVNRLRTEMAEQRAKAERAAANLRLSETNLSYTNIIAPYDGTITRRHSEMGSYLKEGQPVYTMVSDGALEIEVDVPATRVDALKPGVICTFELGKRRFEAVVRAVVPEEDLRTRTRTVRLTPKFGARPAAVAANQSATVHVPVGKGRDVLSVHKDALIASRGQPTAFVVEDGRAQSRTVLVGEAVGNRFEVLNGLKAGDIVVVRGNERLRDGSRVRFNGKDTSGE
jgi:RND family efflux transporter MFP subunit